MPPDTPTLSNTPPSFSFLFQNFVTLFTIGMVIVTQVAGCNRDESIQRNKTEIEQLKEKVREMDAQRQANGDKKAIVIPP